MFHHMCVYNNVFINLLWLGFQVIPSLSLSLFLSLSLYINEYILYFQIFAFRKLEALIHNSNNILSLSLKANAKILINHCHTNRGLVAHRHLFLRYCIAGYKKMPCQRAGAVNIGKEVQFKEDGHAQKKSFDDEISPHRTLMV